jgi:UDP:flavonoid glycosyltransferase YjiC (YdhE family)
LFAAIISACSELDVQLVLSLGRSDAAWDGPLPSGAIVVPYAPQIPLLRRAVAVVTHAGLNTALESLTCGLPMVAIPMANDQPGVASRLAALGVCLSVPPKRASAETLRQVLSRILREPCYRVAAREWQQQIQSAPDVDDAALLIGHALSNRVRLTRQKAATLPRKAHV